MTRATEIQDELSDFRTEFIAENVGIKREVKGGFSDLSQRDSRRVF